LSAIENDAEDFDAMNAFLKTLVPPDAEKPSPEDNEEDDEEETSEDTTEDDGDETSEEPPEEDEPEDEEGDEGEEDDEDGEEKEGDPKKGKRVVLEANADAVVKHKVDGKEVEIPVKDLTRLYGQEASLTRKSQELAAQKKIADETALKHAQGLDTLLTKAKEAYAPYEKLNFFALAKDPNISAEDLNILQSQARAAYDNVAFLTSELDATVQGFNKQRQDTLREQAQIAWNTLADPKTGIEGWSEPVYNSVREYAITNGIAKDVINELVDPAAIKLLHKAMLYDKGQKALTKTVKKTAKTPKKIIKGGAETAGKTKSTGPKGDAAAMKKLRESGSQDDAAAVFLARMNPKD
jgi:hypothetical protein